MSCGIGYGLQHVCWLPSKEFFISLSSSDWIWCPLSIMFSAYWKALHRDKIAEAEVDHSFPSNIKIKKMWNFTTLLLYDFTSPCLSKDKTLLLCDKNYTKYCKTQTVNTGYDILCQPVKLLIISVSYTNLSYKGPVAVVSLAVLAPLPDL